MSMISDKVRVTATIDQELTDWIDEQIKLRRFASRSHALEVAVSELMNTEKMSTKEGNKDPSRVPVTA